VFLCAPPRPSVSFFLRLRWRRGRPWFGCRRPSPPSRRGRRCDVRRRGRRIRPFPPVPPLPLSPRLERSIIAMLKIVASGLAIPCPAMSGAEPWIGSYSPTEPSSPSAADGSIPSEPVIIDASSDRMSPNILPVTTTSKSPGRLIRYIAIASTRMSSYSTSGNSWATSCATSRQTREEASTFALSTLVSLPRRCCARRKPTRRTRAISFSL
jgi:hypothetical protein